MTRLNLLPWREMRRREEDRQALSVLVGASVLAAVVVFYAWLHVGALVDTQIKRNEFLEAEIKRVDNEIKEIKELRRKRDDLLARMKVIQQLQQDRTQIVHLFDDLVHRLPEGVYLTAMKQSGRNFNLTGFAQSNARVSNFMRNLDASEWFTNPDLDVINVKTQGNDRLSQFTLSVQQKVRGEKGDRDGEAARP